MKIKDIVSKVSDNQFIINGIDPKESKSFAVTNCSLSEKIKHVAIDFGNSDMRFVPLDTLLLVLSEMYGKDYITESVNKIVSYDSIKDMEIKTVAKENNDVVLTELEKARNCINNFISTRGYTYTVGSIIHSYLNYYIPGYYISHTMKDCINNLEKELIIMTGKSK